MQFQSAKPTADDIRARLAQIEQLLAADPARADALAGELLKVAPGNAMALLFQGIARRLMGTPAAAVEILTPLSRSWPDAPLPHLQLGLALCELDEREAAAEAMRRAVAAKQDFSDAWLALADLLTSMGSSAEADRAFCMYVKHSTRDPRLVQPAAALRENRLADADTLLRRHIERHPSDVAAMCMLADVATRQARFDDAEELLKKCLQLAPSYEAARHNYAVVLMRQNKASEALREVDHLLASAPTNSALRNLRAAVLVRLAEYEDAITLYQGLLCEHPHDARVWTNLGHTLRTVGRREECVEAYRKAIAAAPRSGEAYWSLANLKTFQMTDAELASMRAQLRKTDLVEDDRVHFNFAIGKALEDRGEFAESFQHYAEGNRLRRRALQYNPEDLTDHVRRSEALFTAEFFAARPDYGIDAPDPIFVIGLPRAGSTLVEQILASHSAVEGTMELPHVMAIAKALSDRKAVAGAAYPEILASMPASELRELGASYIARTRVQRKLNTAFFIDKMPNNFAHVGLIHLMLPRARIIDIRRHPLACGLSVFKHLFARGQHFSYSLEDIARYYCDYVRIMDHFDAVLPGRVHRVSYEALVDNTEVEVRRLLDYCGLPFESSCMRFHENRRAVSTPSSEQVRTPIFREALDHWRHYEPWLGPLKDQLGPLLDSRAIHATVGNS